MRKTVIIILSLFLYSCATDSRPVSKTIRVVKSSEFYNSSGELYAVGNYQYNEKGLLKSRTYTYPSYVQEFVNRFDFSYDEFHRMTGMYSYLNDRLSYKILFTYGDQKLTVENIQYINKKEIINVTEYEYLSSDTLIIKEHQGNRDDAVTRKLIKEVRGDEIVYTSYNKTGDEQLSHVYTTSNGKITGYKYMSDNFTFSSVEFTYEEDTLLKVYNKKIDGEYTMTVETEIIYSDVLDTDYFQLEELSHYRRYNIAP